jgi:type IV secretory pathway VirB10-like protein
VFYSKNAQCLAEAVLEDDHVRGVGWQKITFGEKWHLAIVKAKERFGKVVIENALNECGLERKVEGYGLLKLTTDAAFTPLELNKGDISTIKPGPKKAAKPDHDNSSTSEDDEPRKQKTPAHKRQRRPQRAKKQGGRTAAAAAADSDSGGESEGEADPYCRHSSSSSSSTCATTY